MMTLHPYFMAALDDNVVNFTSPRFIVIIVHRQRMFVSKMRLYRGSSLTKQSQWKPIFKIPVLLDYDRLTGKSLDRGELEKGKRFFPESQWKSKESFIPPLLLKTIDFCYSNIYTGFFPFICFTVVKLLHSVSCILNGSLSHVSNLLF